MVTENPFPGMNPYLLQRWGDAHARLISYCADQLPDLLPDDLRARIQQRVFVESAGDVTRSIYPDVHVHELPRTAQQEPQSRSGTALAEPILIQVSDEAVTEDYIELVDVRSGGRIVTVIELLSPSNKKPGVGRDEYLQKQEEIHRSHSNLVEMDLVLGGTHTTLTPSLLIPASARTPCHVSVFRASRPSRREYYPIPLRQPLPNIRIPLRPTDADVTLDLQALVELCHRRGATTTSTTASHWTRHCRPRMRTGWTRFFGKRAFAD